MAKNIASIRSDFASALNAIAGERHIEPSVVLGAIEEAIVAAYKKDQPGYVEPELVGGDETEPEETYTADIDPLTGEAKVFKIEGKTKTDVTPPGFGRIAAQTAKQVILQKIREAEKEAVLTEYSAKIGTITNGMILRFDGKNVVVDIGRGQGYMPPEEQMRGEFYRMNSRITVYLSDIRETMRGRTIIVSRAAKELVVKLFEREVPEVASGAVEIKAIAREAGVRTKLAVFSSQPGVDPVGSCVGQKGVRVQEVIKDLNNEKIDIIQYTDDPKMYITAALAPAENLELEIDEKKKSAIVTVPDDQVSLAIGRGGQNVRLAARLTGYKLTIKSQSGTLAAAATGDEEFEIDQLNLKKEVRDLLVEKGFTTLEALRENWDDISKLGGIGAKHLEELKKALELSQPQRRMTEEEIKIQADKVTELENLKKNAESTEPKAAKEMVEEVKPSETAEDTKEAKAE